MFCLVVYFKDREKNRLSYFAGFASIEWNASCVFGKNMSVSHYCFLDKLSAKRKNPPNIWTRISLNSWMGQYNSECISTCTWNEPRIFLVKCVHSIVLLHFYNNSNWMECRKKHFVIIFKLGYEMYFLGVNWAIFGLININYCVALQERLWAA